MSFVSPFMSCGDCPSSSHRNISRLVSRVSASCINEEVYSISGRTNVLKSASMWEASEFLHSTIGRGLSLPSFIGLDVLLSASNISRKFFRHATDRKDVYRICRNGNYDFYNSMFGLSFLDRLSYFLSVGNTGLSGDIRLHNAVSDAKKICHCIEKDVVFSLHEIRVLLREFGCTGDILERLMEVIVESVGDMLLSTNKAVGVRRLNAGDCLDDATILSVCMHLFLTGHIWMDVYQRPALGSAINRLFFSILMSSIYKYLSIGGPVYLRIKLTHICETLYAAAIYSEGVLPIGKMEDDMLMSHIFSVVSFRCDGCPSECRRRIVSADSSSDAMCKIVSSWLGFQNVFSVVGECWEACFEKSRFSVIPNPVLSSKCAFVFKSIRNALEIRTVPRLHSLSLLSLTPNATSSDCILAFARYRYGNCVREISLDPEMYFSMNKIRELFVVSNRCERLISEISACENKHRKISILGDWASVAMQCEDPSRISVQRMVNLLCFLQECCSGTYLYEAVRKICQILSMKLVVNHVHDNELLSGCEVDHCRVLSLGKSLAYLIACILHLQPHQATALARFFCLSIEHEHIAPRSTGVVLVKNEELEKTNTGFYRERALLTPHEVFLMENMS